ncbi:MAG: hypothetical protein IJH86_00135 [Clostridia bacterium]|nr:hypothetical protein [Clostridia bacterium]
MSKNGKNRPSILNWMGTLILYGIPGVNLIFLILTIIFAKTGAKRNFAIAALLLMVLCVLLVCAAFVAFPDYFTRMAQSLRDAGETVSIP